MVELLNDGSVPPYRGITVSASNPLVVDELDRDFLRRPPVSRPTPNGDEQLLHR